MEDSKPVQADGGTFEIEDGAVIASAIWRAVGRAWVAREHAKLHAEMAARAEKTVADALSKACNVQPLVLRDDIDSVTITRHEGGYRVSIGDSAVFTREFRPVSAAEVMLLLRREVCK